MFCFSVTKKVCHLQERLLIIVEFSFWIFTFVSNFQLQLDHTIWIVKTLRFFIRTSKEGRLVSPKYRET